MTSRCTGESPGPELGASLLHWQHLIEQVSAALPGAEFVWKTYAGKTGRQCVIRSKDRNLAYLKPGDGSFMVSIALSDRAVASVGKSKLPSELIAEVKASARYPEGTPARVRVDSGRSLQHALTLLSIKIEDVDRTKSRRR
jgi:hypothetical protein